MARKEKISSEEKFELYYSSLYKDRWPRLKEALLKDSKPVSLSDKLLEPYYMDKASILAASMLPIEENNNVLDMCAAPGGKSLSIALRLNGTGSLTSNDRSASRRNRLINVLNTCLDPSLRSNIKVTGFDSSKWSLYEKDAYDKVLLDAPCSSERHVINDNKALSIWSANRPKTLSILQFAMLASALDVCKKEGFILYSTCSICPSENEDIIKKLYKKRSGRFEEVDLTTIDSNIVNLSEKLEHGRIVLPDVQDGSGPLYFCLLKKI